MGLGSSSALLVWFCAHCSLKHHGRFKGVFDAVVVWFLVWEMMEEGLSHGADLCFTFRSLLHLH